MMEFNEAIKHCLEVAEQNEAKALRIGRQYKGTLLDREAKECRECAADHRQLAEWLTELKELREENKVLTSECDRLIKEKGELNELKEKAVLDICRREARLRDAKRLLKAAIEDFKEINSDILTCKYCKWYSAETDECTFPHGDTPCEKICGWKHEGEALALIGSEANHENPT